MLQYLLKLTISLSIVYLFYQLFLRRLTFYTCNRWYLLIYSMVCFVIPFINVFTIIIKQPALRESAFVNYIPAITQITPADNTTGSVGINWLLVTAIVFIAGILVMIARLLVQYYSLYKMRSKAVLLYDDKVKLYHIDAPVMPFSFGRGIYVNQHQHSEHELKEIIRHEFIHVKQRHSLDIIWSELLCILNWYNPFAWLLRHDIRQNLEFIADQQVLQTGLDRKQYQYLLLKVIGVNSFSIAANFNFSSLKKRIAMMNKAKSARVHLIRFLFLLPLLVVVLLAFRNSTRAHRQPLHAPVTDTIPTQPPGWKDLQTIDVNDNGRVTIRLKNGKVEKYTLTNAKDKEAFERKYGKLPEPPTPPTPPLAPVTFDGKEMPEAPEKPEALAAPERDDMPEALAAPERDDMPEAPEPPEAPEMAEQLKVPPPPIPMQGDCFNKKGFCVTVADNYGECIVIVKDKNNKIVQAVSLADWIRDKQYEDKYGEIPNRQIRLMPKIGVKAKPTTAVDAKPGTLVNVEPVNDVVISDKVVTKIALSAKTAVEPHTVTLINLQPVHKVMVIDRKIEAKPVVSNKTAAEAKATAEVKAAVEAKASAEAKAAAEARAKSEPAQPAKPSKEQE